MRLISRCCCALAVVAFLAELAPAQTVVSNDAPAYGPYNGAFLAGGDGLEKRIDDHDPVLQADSPWTLYCWVYVQEPIVAPTLVAGIGDPNEEYPRYLALDKGKVILWLGKGNELEANLSLPTNTWIFLGASFDGSIFHLYSGWGVAEVANGRLALGSVRPVLEMAPSHSPWPNGAHFGGKIAGLTLLRAAVGTDAMVKLGKRSEDFADNIEFEEASKPWPFQTRDQAGYRAPQDPSTMPHSRTGVPAESSPLYRSVRSEPTPAIQRDGENTWTIGDWKLAPAPALDDFQKGVQANGSELSSSGVVMKSWMPATVPGTVLTSLVNDGIYPDPDYGLNNLVIPESLNKQDYWYRTEFNAPAGISTRRLTLTFEGINYAAEVWLNGEKLGNIKGAFIRGIFDVTQALKADNVLAVKISPPPHPGIPQEQSIKGGPGENGGEMCLDGPTFVATEGWDWIPAIRDRDSGIWQPVVLSASGSVKIGDAQIITSLPLPDTSRADVVITVPLENTTSAAVHGTLRVSLEGVAISKDVTVVPGQSEVKLTPKEFSQLTIQRPRLWWPNGYGKQDLYDLKLSFNESGKESDAKQVRFGIREITYELSLLDSIGHLRRLEYSPTVAAENNQHVVDVSHNGMRSIPPADPFPSDFPKEWKPGWKSWVASLIPGGENSPSIHMLTDTQMTPYLVIKVNGVRIAARGGNWGMDDSRKRVSRERLEPYFKLHHDANLNIIRNWVGQDTEETFYDLADEYGMLVWNDFWESTQDYNIEAEDPQLFLDNARDVILRFRNHPSIVMWCGRNEGVPQPIINMGLDKLIRELDGTRYYSPSSNQVNLQNSGPYRYMDPGLYYTTLNHGFSVETGTPSLSTLEGFRAAVPEADQWPIDDVWAYHDWHASGNGDMHPFMNQIETEFGAATSLEDLERKAQMLNYVDHRAIFEGMDQHLWSPNSGRMLWMTQPAWPSNVWQIFSHDYDTQASYYGVKKACEPLHVQLDLSNYDVAVVNTTTESHSGLGVSAKVYSLDNKLLFQHEEKKDVSSDATTQAFKLDLAPLFSHGVILVKLELRDAGGQLLSDNLYWLAASSAGYRQLNQLVAATVSVSPGSSPGTIRLENSGNVPALEIKLTLLDPTTGLRILPVYYSDNYVSLLPGESKEISLEMSSYSGRGSPNLSIRGWNLSQTVRPAFKIR